MILVMYRTKSHSPLSFNVVHQVTSKSNIYYYYDSIPDKLDPQRRYIAIKDITEQM